MPKFFGKYQPDKDDNIETRQSLDGSQCGPSTLSLRRNSRPIVPIQLEEQVYRVYNTSDILFCGLVHSMATKKQNVD
jgi:hypothetical protein